MSRYDLERMFRLAADKNGGNAGATDGESESTESRTEDATGENSGETGDDTEQESQPQFTQAQLDAIVKDRLARANAKAEAERKKAEEAAQAAALKDQQKWQELAEQHEAKLRELEPQAESLTARAQDYEQRLQADLAAEIKDWPAEVLEMDPGPEAALLDRLAWRDKAKALAAKLLDAAGAPGNSRRPKSAGPAGDDKARQEAIAAQRRFTHRQF